MTHYQLVLDQTVVDPLTSPAWVAWNERRTGFTATEIVCGEGDANGAKLSCLIYTDDKGRVRMPPLNPYLPLAFRPSPTTKNDRIYSQWTELAGELADEFATRQIKGRINFPPKFVDARPFQWAGFQAEWRYTFVADLEKPVVSDSSVRKRTRKAETKGYTVTRGGGMVELLDCLNATEQRKGFGHHLSLRDLESLSESFDSDLFRTYVVRGRDGGAVSAGARLTSEKGWALDWVQGAIPSHLANGVNQLMYRAVLEDLAKDGIKFFDMGGANIKAVAKAKSAWGFPTVPYISLTSLGVANQVRSAAYAALKNSPRLLRGAEGIRNLGR